MSDSQASVSPSKSPSPGALELADRMLGVAEPAAVMAAMAAAAAGIPACAAAEPPASASDGGVPSAAIEDCTAHQHHTTCIGCNIEGDPCSKRIVRKSKRHGRGVVCTACDTSIVRCANKQVWLWLVQFSKGVHSRICSASILCTRSAMKSALTECSRCPKNHGRAHLAAF